MGAAMGMGMAMPMMGANNLNNLNNMNLMAMNGLNAMNGMNGNLMAGTLRSAQSQSQSQSQSPSARNPYLASSSRNPYLPPKANQKKHFPPSIATTAMPSTMGYLEKKLHSGKANAKQKKQSKEKQSKAQNKKEHLQGPIDKSSARYRIEYNHDLPPPWSLTDFHWVCYHYRSGQKYSCRFGNECRWRHHDFEMRTDIKTAWSATIAKEEKHKPTQRDIIEAKFEYLKAERKRKEKEQKERKDGNEEEKKDGEEKEKKEEVQIELDEKHAEEKEEKKEMECDVEVEVKKGKEKEKGELVGKIFEGLTTLDKILEGFKKPKGESVDYYLIGRFASQQLQHILDLNSAQKSQ